MTARDVTVRTPDAELEGQLTVFPGATAVVAFAHGSGSSRHSPRNQAVARGLQRSGIATLLLDLLTFDEERVDNVTGQQRFDIDLLTRRLTGAVDWLTAQDETAGVPVALFGASTGAAAALRTAAERPDTVQAVVSRGGRPDLAGTAALQVVRAPTLLIVGGADTDVLKLNEEAADWIGGPSRIHVVPRATHLFEEEGALEEVTDAASDWFTTILGEAER
ncbi:MULTISPECIES: dienelactone hydrolase family protein [unclassified Nocardiopsis]|uniref:dienelactone hydrolase family protein n=1 Tax=unclassified Nocardiopsis TaxID=2649073 RepID=UPI001359A268|nr:MULTISPECIES: alpha/beta fold hydrolase [unclassified Nocardiopsis]